MVLEFTKMDGAGNDFIVVDNRSRKLEITPEQAVRLCHRQHGIGADGLVLLVPGRSGQAPWAWEFYNSDGSVAEMCGNASRCFARYVRRLVPGSGPLAFETLAGVITAEFDGDLVSVNLTAPQNLRLSEKIPLAGGPLEVHSLNTGVPHAVVFVPDVEKVEVLKLGAEIRRHPHFAPKGTNVNFAQVLAAGQLRVRTFERGVEGETLACGTGVTATALIAAKVYGFQSPVAVRVQGGDTLGISFAEAAGGFDKVRLRGPAQFVFEGRVELA